MSVTLDGVRFDGQPSHVESYFIKINDPSGERALWLKATILAAHNREPVAETWAVAFERGKPAVAAKETIAYRDAHFDARAIDLRVGCLALDRKRVHGSVGKIAFDLALEDPGPPIVHYPHPRMYEGRFPSSKFVSPMPDLRATGEVHAGDATWKIDRWRGLLGHNWGKSHAFAYAWGHCNIWDEASDLVFEGTSGRVRTGPIIIPTTSIFVVRLGGETHALTRFRHMIRNHGEMTFRRWQFSGRGPTITLRGEMWAETDDMVGLHYENPDGAMTYCLNSKLASARLEVAVHGQKSRTFTSRASALEIGTRDPRHGVEMVA